MSRRYFACEEKFLIEYKERILNATSEDRKQAMDLFSSSDLPSILDIRGNKAIINIVGPLSNSGPSPLDILFGYGGTSYLEVIESINTIKLNEEIDNVILRMDTPGGEVKGVDEVWQALDDLKKSKHIVAENHGMVASAGYWIASASNEIIAKSPTVETGSIGVIITAVDYSKMEEAYGIKTIQIVSRNAPNKRPDLTTEKGRSLMQERVDSIERIFISRIAEGRKIKEKYVEENFGRGGLLIASDPDQDKEDAESVGMIDSVISKCPDKEVTALEEENNSNIDQPKTEKNTKKEKMVVQDEKKNNSKGEKMDLKEFLEQNPGAQVEIDKIKSDSIEVGQKSVEARITKVMPFLSSSDYKDAHKFAYEVLEGKKSFEAFEGVVGYLDMEKERKNSADAQSETTETGETPSQEQNLGAQNGVVNSEDDYQAAVNRMKGGK